ncbi:MAG: DNA repair protein RadC [Bacillota bacterium]|nr:DNA repair protein RadC [Bacillota bacterium]
MEVKDKQGVESKDCHNGHRQRMKQRFAETGLMGFSDHNVLEMLLFYAIPRKDTNLIAHELINYFGSYAAVLEASREGLMQVNGISEHTATLISLVTQMNKRYLECKSVESKRISSSEEAGKYLVAKFAYETNECAFAMLLDEKMRILSCQKISQGVVNGTEISIRALCELALKFRAKGVIISHNHPSGVLLPSAEDEQCTQAIKNALKVIDVNLCDHVIVAGEKYISLNAYGMI